MSKITDVLKNLKEKAASILPYVNLDEIDAMLDAIGGESPIDALKEAVAQAGIVLKEKGNE